MTKKKISTDSVIKDIFAPLETGQIAEDAPPDKKDIFFRKEESVALEEILEPKPLPVPVENLPHSVSRKPKTRFLFWGVLGACLMLGAHLVLSFLEWDGSVRGRASLLEAKRKQSSILVQKLVEKKAEEAALQEKLAAYRKEKGVLTTRLKRLEPAFSHQGPSLGLLTELGPLRPEGVWLGEFSVSKGKISLRGFSFDQDLIGLFMDRLRKSSFLKSEGVPIVSPIVKGGEERAETLYSFQIDAKLAR